MIATAPPSVWLKLVCVLSLLALPRALAAQCGGDCDGSQQVQVHEVVTLIGIALGELPLSGCDAGDSDSGGSITVDEVLSALDHALRGCAEPRSGIAWRSDFGDVVGQGRTAMWGPASDDLRAVEIVGGVSVLIGYDDQLSLFRFGAPRGATLLPGRYEGAVRYPNNEHGEPGLDVQLRGRACVDVVGRFDILELTIGEDGEVISFAADFEQRCGETPAALHGEVRFNSIVPFSPPPVTGDIRVPEDATTITGAISRAVSGDRILVGPGEYEESIDFSGKQIEVIATAGPDRTEIVGLPGSTVVRFGRGEGRAARLRGFTIRDGRFGVVVSDGAGPTLEDNILSNHQVGVRVEAGSPLIRSSVVADNSHHAIELIGEGAAEIRNNVIANNGGRGIRMFDAGDVVVSGNRIRNNGGGIEMVGVSAGRIEQNLIVGNQALEGGGISWFLEEPSGSTRVTSNTIADNRSGRGAALFIDGTAGSIDLRNNLLTADEQVAIECGPGAVVASYHSNLIWSGESAAIAACRNPIGANGNFSEDPLFVDSLNGDYHLASGSPAIDAGGSVEIAVDLDGESRPLDGDGNGSALHDLGVDEHTGE